MKIIFLFLLCIVTWTARAGSLVEGVIYLKDGRNLEFRGRDRLQIPCRQRDVKGVHDAFAKTKRKEVYPMEEVDSVVCWHAKTPEYRRKFLPSSFGWSWVYFDAPHMTALVYATKGYGVATNGGINIYQRRGFFTRSGVKYYLRKQGEKEFYFLGRVKSQMGKAFCKRLCNYVADDTELCDRIRHSNTWCSKAVLMLREYNPQN